MTTAFVVGAVISNVLLLRYAFWSKWWTTVTGWVLVSTFGIFALSYDLSVLFLFWPDTFDGGGGLAIRIVARWLINGMLIALLLLTLRAQKRDRIVRLNAPPEGVRQSSTE